jgi:hypothetical protein
MGFTIASRQTSLFREAFLRTRFLLIAWISTLLLTGILWSYLPGQVQNVFIEEILQKGKESTQNLENVASGALIVGDSNALQQLSKGFLRTDHILYVVVLDKDGHVVAQGGQSRQAAASIERILGRARKSEADWSQADTWPQTNESYYHLVRPVFYEQLRVGTLLLGISAKQATAVRSLIQRQILILGFAIFILATVVGWIFSRSVSRPLRQLEIQLDPQANASDSMKIKGFTELRGLQEKIAENRGLYEKSLHDMESLNFELTQQLASLQEKNDLFSSRLNSVNRQMESLRLKISQFGTKTSNSGAPLPPAVQFALSMTPEVIAAMEQIRESASTLNADIKTLVAYVGLLETSPEPSEEDFEAIRQYREFINYERIIQQVAELMETIQSGAAWSEQLANLLNQLEQDSSPR